MHRFFLLFCFSFLSLGYGQGLPLDSLAPKWKCSNWYNCQIPPKLEDFKNKKTVVLYYFQSW